MSHIVIDARESGTTTGRYVDKLIEYLHELKPKSKVTLLVKKHRLEFFKETTPSFNVEETPAKEFTFSEQTGLLFQINKLKADVVHFPMVQQPILYRGKTVTTMQDLTGIRYRNPYMNPVVHAVKLLVYKGVNKYVAHKSDAIICPSEFVKEDVAKYTKINSRDIKVTYESADKITDVLEEVEQLKEASYIMYVGRPAPHKNLYRLVSGFAELKTKQPNLKLALVGKKDIAYKELEKWVTEQSISNVVFTDFVSEGQLRWLYENTQAYVFPSLSEGFGLPGLEAMCHGAPVVSSNATCLPEIYGDAAHYFDPTDIDDIASKINDVVSNNSLRSSLIKKGYDQLKKYSWKKMAEQTLEIYESLL